MMGECVGGGWGVVGGSRRLWVGPATHPARVIGWQRA
jgi:hypothetical protein